MTFTALCPGVVTEPSRKESITYNNLQKDKAVILLSGGLDSTSLLYYMLDKGYDCYPLTILYGQKHSKEVIAARNICEVAGLIKKWKMLDLSILGNLLPSSLTGTGQIPEGYYKQDNMSLTVVPGRNLILLAIAAGYAQGLEAQIVAYAAHSGDHFIYPDCRPEFIKAAGEAIKVGYGIELQTPFSNIDKGEIVKIGSELEVPYYMTWTCYNGRDKHCGKCGSCTERKEAFVKAEVIDPTVYE
jgi:7-cyano-7-deazaguanine synthase